MLGDIQQSLHLYDPVLSSNNNDNNKSSAVDSNRLLCDDSRLYNEKLTV